MCVLCMYECARREVLSIGLWCAQLSWTRWFYENIKHFIQRTLHENVTKNKYGKTNWIKQCMKSYHFHHLFSSFWLDLTAFRIWDLTFNVKTCNVFVLLLSKKYYYNFLRTVHCGCVSDDLSKFIIGTFNQNCLWSALIYL